MTSISALEKIHKKGLYGDYENKNENNLIKICEIKKLLIIQIVQHKSSSIKADLTIDGISFPNEAMKTNNNEDTRVLWSGPKNWLLISKKKDLLKKTKEILNEKDFAITDLSHSRAILSLTGANVKEVLKKGCPYNINELKKNNSVNSVFNGITVTIDILEENPEQVRIYCLRSFGESLYHSITDACLEFGYKNI
jgi:sarcosine oxidase subunit gamma